jgi:ribosomal protein L13
MPYTFTPGQILTAGDLTAVIAQTATTATNASTLATGTVVETVLPFRMNQNVTTTSNVTFANVVITGNLTVQGVTTSINTSNLDITDLNITVAKNAANSLQANGGGLTIAGANVQFFYNDVSNNMILSLPISIGNATGNATLSSSTLNINSIFIANTTGAYHTGTVNAASHTVGATFTANATLVNAAAINITGQVNTVTLYATTSANIASAVQANATGLWTTGTVNAASHTVGATFTANATLVNAAAINITGQVNTATFYATTTANVGANVQLTTSTLSIGNSTVNATVNSTTFSGISLTANNASYLGGIIATSYLSATANINFTGANIYFGNSTTTSNVYFQNNSVIYANNRFGTVNQILSSNGTAMYWADSSSAATNTLYAFTWTNTHTHGNTTQQANVVYANGVIIANSAFGTAGQALTSDGTKMYWSTIVVNAAAQYSWTNTHTFSNTVTFNANSFATTMANGTSNTSIATTAYVQNSLARIYYANGTQAFP